ncbi:hypothetical protein PROFUN_00395 [Planoprotostelium fungivorum]|uniref:RNA helicase n=1 Tax=Planoprotostelium fungivorum TaxID=1890364 RepID=A0A2P6NY89_9EUKA|nr:hypothetical protein PROFUN_00395 [Planoprotostelium fungivorum]
MPKRSASIKEEGDAKETPTQKWRKISVSADSTAGDSGLYSLEEIDPSDFFGSSYKPLSKKDLAKKIQENGDEKETTEKKKTKKSAKPKKEQEIGDDAETTEKTTKKKGKAPKPQKKKGKKQVQVKLEEGTAEIKQEEGVEEMKEEAPIEEKEENKIDMILWNTYGLDSKILRALSEEGFDSPTEIQKASMLASLRDRKDVVGAAQTGSGKTLAFGIPMINTILNRRSSETGEKCLKGLVMTPTRELAMQIYNHLKKICVHTDVKIAPIIGGIAAPKQERLLSYKPDIIVATPGRLWDLMSQSLVPYVTDIRDLQYLVIDEADRMIQAGCYAELNSILSSLPLQYKSEDQAKVEPLQSIKKEETQEEEESDTEDVGEAEEHEEEGEQEEEEGEQGEEGEEGEEEGKYEQPEDELSVLKQEQQVQQKYPRQTYIYSATLTTETNQIDVGRQHTTLDTLLARLSFQRPIKIINLLSRGVVASSITEYKIECMIEEKDVYLYYFLSTHKGRTLVFVNSIVNIHKLVSILAHLGTKVLPLHANMQQKQRLRNLERFTAEAESVLVATDVAARGLDIPHVDHVIHYQMPKHVETYVHRSGRTGRAKQKGISVSFIQPGEVQYYRKICKALNKEDMSRFDVNRSILPQITDRIKLARQIVKDEAAETSAKVEKSEMKNLAQAGEIELDERDSDDEELARERKVNRMKLKGMKAQLAQMLKVPLFASEKKVESGGVLPFQLIRERQTNRNESKYKQHGRQRNGPPQVKRLLNNSLDLVTLSLCSTLSVCGAMNPTIFSIVWYLNLL